MGCAGSRPSQIIQGFGNGHHHHHHVNSPQKGFILFNAKTIEYLQANELEIKEKLRQRCEQKLTKAIPQSMSSKSLLSNAKRTLLFNNNNNSTPGNNTGEVVAEDSNKSINGVKQNKSDASLTLNGTINQDSKVMAIDAAVDYVLKYALNDFDIENFKSSNHLSMKQIRKDIVKKNNSVSSLSKLNNSVNNSTAGTLSNQSKTATLSKGFDASFYKQALNVAIDEFGLFVQENFIIINEFEKSAEIDKVDQIVKETSETEDQQKDKEELDVEALKLKEALEVARHNFYKGKISMVCLTKAGGYVVKEVKDQAPVESEGVVVLNGSDKKGFPSSPEQAKPACVIPEINIQSAEQTEKNLEAKSEEISEELNKIELLTKKAFENKEALNIEELLLIKSNLIEMLNKSVDSVMEFTNDKTVESKETDTLTSNLGNSKRVIELLRTLNESESEKVDHGLVEALVNLDNVNKELNDFIKETDGNSELKNLVVDIENLNQDLPTVLFTSKSFKAPQKLKSTNAEKKSPKISAPVDIKKEIAFSILNVGEVLAKTIDYYSHDPQSNEMKDLISMSNKQETKLENTEALVAETEKLTPKANEVIKEHDNQIKSCSSSLVSPSVSTSSSINSLPQDSASPMHKKQDTEKDLPAEPTTPVPPPELNLDCNAVAHDNKSTPQQEIIERTDMPDAEYKNSDCDLSEKDDFKPLDNNEIIAEKVIEEETVVLIKSETKSSSSSSDVLSNEEILMETTEKVIYNEEKEANPVVFRETLFAENQTSKRMSLDEELFYHLEDVDKKVKYMNETCSEDDGEDDDDDLDDENFDYDESVELENANDERLFHPRTPAKIKSEVRNNRAVDLQEEIKQISNVIQDLVQTINVRNNTNTSDVIPQQTADKLSLENSDNNNGDSEDGSQNSGSGGDCKTKSYHYNRNSSGSHNSGHIADRKSINSRRSVGNQSLNSSIPISVSRQKNLRKSSTIEDSNEFINTESTNDSFADYNEHEVSPERSQLNNSNVNKSASSQRFRSKLPVKK